MKPEHRDAIVAQLEKQMIAAGARDYDDGMEKLTKIIEWLKEHHDPMRTKEQFEQLLNTMPDPPRIQMQLLFGALKFMPQVMRFAIQKVATVAEEQLPELRRGRPGLDLVTKEQIVASIVKKACEGVFIRTSKEERGR